MILKYNIAIDSTSIMLPFSGAYSITVDWGDGSAQEAFDSVSSPITSHVFAESGKYNITVTGSVEHFGTEGTIPFTGIEYLEKVDAFDLTELTNIKGAFLGARILRSVPDMLPAGITDLSNVFKNAEYYNGKNISTWDVSSVTDFTDFLTGTNFSVASYDDVLNAWSELTLQPDVALDMTGFIYSKKGVDARNAIIAQGWTINGDSQMQSAMQIDVDTTLSDGTTVEFYANPSGGSKITVDWGDGTDPEDYLAGTVKCQHTYAEEGQYTVTITGDLYRFGNYYYYNQGTYDGSKITAILSFGDLGLADLCGAFAAAPNLTQVPEILPPGVIRMVGTFEGCSSFNQDISKWDVSRVNDMRRTFRQAYAFNQSLDKWDVSSVSTFGDGNIEWGSFFKATSFNGNIENWDVSASNKFVGMFRKSAFNGDISRWEVKGNMSNFLHDTPYNHPSINRLDVSNVGSFQNFFANTDFNQPLDRWVFSTGNLSSLFWYAKKFNQDISNWDVSNVKYFNNMFKGSAFDQPIGSWNMSNAIDINGMFAECPFNHDIENWDTSKVTDMGYTFYKNEEFNQPLNGWNVSSVTNMTGMFCGAKSFNQDLDQWDVSSLLRAGKFVVYPAYSHGMFQSASAFNGNISTWDVSNVENMAAMFKYATSFNQDLDQWDLSSLTDATGMFYGASSFNGNISTWVFPNLTTTTGMFANATSFNQPIGNWNMSSVNSVRNMFQNADSFNQDISGWDVSNVQNFSNMFTYADSFDQNLGSWDIRGADASGLTNIFGGGYIVNPTFSPENYAGILKGWAQLDPPVPEDVTIHFGESKWDISAQSARDFLINNRGWKFIDNGPFDSIAPSWISLPQMVESSDTTAAFNIQIDEPGTVYYTVLPKNAEAPSIEQVMSGHDANGTTDLVFFSGSMVLEANEEKILTVNNLIAGETYQIFIVAEDNADPKNVQENLHTINFNTSIGGSGTALDPYQIKTVEHFDMIRDYLGTSNTDVHFKLMNDLDFTFDTTNPMGLFYNDGAGWDPIGEGDGPVHVDGLRFNGILDGNGHKIIGINIKRPTSSEVAIFSEIRTGTIKNLGVEDCVIVGGRETDSLTGVIAARLSDFESYGPNNIINCYTKNCTVEGENASAFIPVIGTTGVVEKCYAHGTVSGTNEASGFGISISGTVNNCYSRSLSAINGSGLPFAIEFNPTFGGSISNCYYHGTEDAIPGTTAVSSLDDMKLAATYVNLDIADYDDYVNEIFKINDGHDYPILGWETPETVTRTIGSTGGSVELTTKKAKIDVPASALTEDKAISVSAKVETEPDTKYRRHTPVYKFGPDGTTFAQPAKVRFSLEGVDIEGKNLAVFWSTETPDVFERIGGIIVDVEGVNYIEAEVDHFSEGFVSDVTEHTISFNTEYGSVDSVTVFDGFSIERPEDPVEPNMILAYWYTEGPVDGVWDEETRYEFGTPVTSDLSLYARWVPEEETIPYQFGGWYTSETVQDDTTIWDFENDGMPAADIELYARWIENPNLIKFVTNGGHAVSTREFQDDAAQYLLPEQVPHPWFEGHIFEGWYADEALTEPFDFSADPSVHQNDETPDDVTVYAKWSLESYTVIFNDATDKDEVPFANEVVTYGETIQTLTQPDPIKEGYKFVAWYTEAPVGETWNEEARFDTTIMPDPNPQTEDTTTEFNLYARYEIEVYTIVYNTEYGIQPADELIEWGQYVPDYTDDVIHEGHHIEGWYKDAEFTIPFDFTVPIPDPYEDIAEDSVINLYAKWAVDTYTVVYNVGQDAGVSKSSEEATFGSTLNAPSTTKVGYTLEGWYLTPSFDDGTKWAFDGESEPTTVFDKDPESHNNGDTINLYAKWVVEQYTLEFDTTDGGSEITPVVCQYNQPYPVVAEPIKEGYTFAGWYSDSEYTDQISLGSQDDLVPDPNPGSEDFGTTITIYAKFTINTYTVTFVNKGIDNPYFKNLIGDSNDEDGIGSPSFTTLPVNFNETFDGPEGMVQEGFTFEGWYTEDGTNFDRFEADGTWNSEAKWDHANDTMPASDLTLYAHWSRNEHAITFVSNNGSTFEAIDVKFGDELGDSIVSTREGYSFKGWYTTNGTGLDDDLSGGTWDESDKWVFDTSLMPDADVTLYARWAINDYLVTFDANGGTFENTGTAINTVNVEYGQFIPEPTPPKRKRFPFIDDEENN